MLFYTADQHYGHKNIIRYCNRPFFSVEEMDEVLMENHNNIVKSGDTVIHCGDFALVSKNVVFEKYIRRLNGNHVFLRGSHDRWMDRSYSEIDERSVNGQRIIACHYCLRTWSASHYNSWHVFGHSHGTLEPIGKSWDVGVDSNLFYPVSIEQLISIMEKRPDNPNLVRK